MRVTFLLMILLLAGGAVEGQSSSRFFITRNVVASGGTTFSSSSRFQLGSTIAQPAAAVPASSRFSIQGGFWIWPAPIIFSPAKNGTNFVISFQTELGEKYTVQYSSSLSAINWQSLPSVAGNGSVESVTNSSPGASQQFYRLLQVP